MNARAKTGKRRLVLAVASSAAAAALVYFGYGAWSRIVDLRHRFQLVEERVRFYGQFLAAEDINYQATRGPAKFSPAGSPWNLDAGIWAKIGGNGENGGWDSRDFTNSKALGVHRDQLYVGLCSVEKGNAQIWKFDGARWQVVWQAKGAGDRRGLTCVHVLASNGDAIYAGVDDTVWRDDGTQGWQIIGGRGVGQSWPTDAKDEPYSMEFFRGALMVGMRQRAAVFEFANGRWRNTTENPAAFGERYSGVYELRAHTDGCLYAGMIAPLGTIAAVFRYDGARWEQVGGDGLLGSWRSRGSTYALSMASYQGQLVVATNRHPMIPGNFSSIWAFNGKEWHPVGLGHIPSLWGEMHNYNAMIVFDGSLIIGGGGHPGGNATAWLLKTGAQVTPVKIGGHGVNGSWGGRRDGRLTTSPPAPSEYVYRFAVWRGTLIAGFGLDAGTAQVWQYRPPPGRNGSGTSSTQ